MKKEIKFWIDASESKQFLKFPTEELKGKSEENLRNYFFECVNFAKFDREACTIIEDSSSKSYSWTGFNKVIHDTSKRRYLNGHAPDISFTTNKYVLQRKLINLFIFVCIYEFICIFHKLTRFILNMLQHKNTLQL